MNPILPMARALLVLGGGMVAACPERRRSPDWSKYKTRPATPMWGLFALLVGFTVQAPAAVYELRPATVDQDELFERMANALKAGDVLVLHGGNYSQNGRRAVTARGEPGKPIVIRAAQGEHPVLTRPADNIDRHNNIEFVDCAYLIIRGLHFRGGSSGVRFIRGHHITFEDCEIEQTGNNALTMNSGDCHDFVIRRNHIHHTGLSTAGPTEGEGMYIGCHNGSCRTWNTLIEGNYIHHLRGTSGGGNDGIEIKRGSFNNIVRDNVIHDTNLGRAYPGIFVYGGGAGTNLVERNVIWRAGEGIQVVSDAVVRNNIIFDCLATGITAGPHAAVPQVRRVAVVHNTIAGAPIGVRMRWAQAQQAVFANNAIYCPGRTAVRSDGKPSATLRRNFVQGALSGVRLDAQSWVDGGSAESAFGDFAKHDFWPRPASPLIGRADAAFAVSDDFNHQPRRPPCDVGAYETDGRARNPGWTIAPGFKPLRNETEKAR